MKTQKNLRKTLAKILVLVLILPVQLIPIGCTGSDSYDLLHDRSQIVSIEIVEYADGNVSDPLTEGTVLAVIEDRESFIDGLLALDRHDIMPISSPMYLEYDIYPVIRITYSNGEYELISCAGNRQYLIPDSGQPFLTSYCWEYFDTEEYLAFIGQYI